MQDWDGWLHVNPMAMGQQGVKEPEVAVGVFFNPTGEGKNATISLPLYYAGIDQDALVSVDDGHFTHYSLSRDYSIDLTLSMQPKSIHRVVVRRPTSEARL